MQTYHQPSVSLRQSFEVRDICCTVEVSIPCLLRQNTCLHACLPTPLRRTFGYPGPVEPAPSLLEARHLRHSVHHQPLLVDIAIRAWISIGL